MNLDIKHLPGPIKAFFNGIAQVVFIENVISGAAIFLSFLIAQLEMNNWNFGLWNVWKPFVFVAIGVNIGNAMAYLMGADKEAIKAGLFGFCPCLVAIGAYTFTGGANGDELTQWITCCAGCIICVPTQIVINRFTGHFGLPGFTFPFIVITWFFTLMSFGTELLDFGRAGVLANNAAEIGGWMSQGAAAFDSLNANWNNWLLFFLNGWEEIYILDGWIASLVILAAYFWFKWDFALKACIAVAVSIGFELIASVNMGQAELALFTYSAILTVGALDTFGKTKKNTTGRYWFLFFLGLILTCLINYAIGAILGTFGLPNCTFAFVVAGWIMLVVENWMVEREEQRKAALNA